MKIKYALAMTALCASVAASALEVGVTVNKDFATTPNRSAGGVTLGGKVGDVGLTAGYEQYTKGIDQDKWSFVASYDVLRYGPSTFAVKAGGVYLDNKTGQDGYAWVAGVGGEYSLTKNWALTADYRYQVGQKRVEQFDGSTFGAGLKYKF